MKKISIYVCDEQFDCYLKSNSNLQFVMKDNIWSRKQYIDMKAKLGKLSCVFICYLTLYSTLVNQQISNKQMIKTSKQINKQPSKQIQKINKQTNK